MNFNRGFAFGYTLLYSNNMKLTIEKNEGYLKVLIEDAHGQRPYLDVTYNEEDDMFKITEHEIGREREMDLFSALAYAVTIADRYDLPGAHHVYLGNFFAHEVDQALCEEEGEEDFSCSDINTDFEIDGVDNPHAIPPISVYYLILLDENTFDDRAYFELRPYIFEAIRTRAMTKYTDMNQCFCPYVTKVKERKDPNLK